MRAYLDHAATTPLSPSALDAMGPYLTEHYGNPSSLHAEGRRARAALDEARAGVARLIGAKAREIVFTASGSEADNLALKGAAWANSPRGRHVLVGSAEHKAVRNAAAVLERQGWEVTWLPVDADGGVDTATVEAAISERTSLVSVMLANNEVGTINPIAEIGRVCRARGVLFHTDAVQAAGHLPIDVNALGVDLLSLSAHKLHGPKGIGALFVRQGTALLPQVHGGAQESQRRAGTEYVAGAVGFAAALREAMGDPVAAGAERTRLEALRDRLMDGLAGLPGTRLTGHPTQRLPGIASAVIDGVEGGDLVAALDLEGVAASTGSACTSGSDEPSHVLLAMGIDERTAHGSLRLSAGRDTTPGEVEFALAALERVLARMRVPA